MGAHWWLKSSSENCRKDEQFAKGGRHDYPSALVCVNFVGHWTKKKSVLWSFLMTFWRGIPFVFRWSDSGRRAVPIVGSAPRPYCGDKLSRSSSLISAAADILRPNLGGVYHSANEFPLLFAANREGADLRCRRLLRMRSFRFLRVFWADIFYRSSTR